VEIAFAEKISKSFGIPLNTQYTEGVEPYSS